MYKYLTVLLAIIFGSTQLHAQKVELAFGAGVVSNTPPNIFYGENTFGGISTTMTMKAMLNMGKHWQAGLSLGYVPLSYKTDLRPLYFEDMWQPQDFGPINRSRIKQYVANPAVPVQIETNYRFDIGKFNIYSGVSAGYFVIPQNISFIDGYYNNGDPGGLVGGMQFGAGWFFVPWCAVNGQMTMSYYVPYSVVAFPVTMGLKFRL